MPSICCYGEDHLEALGDVLRVFYGPLDRTQSGLLSAGDTNPLIICDTTADSVRVYLNDQPADDRTYSDLPPLSDNRREARRQLYRLLSHLTGIHLPWGSLTGIRPTLMARDALLHYQDEAMAVTDMTDRWLVSPHQAKLAVAVAKTEETILDSLPVQQPLLYLGVPFCPSRCAYCSFITQEATAQRHLLAPFTQHLIQEIKALLPLVPSKPAVIYMGGGTPTSLPDQQLSAVFDALMDQLHPEQIREFTVEAGRPDTITPTNLAIIRQAGADRLCINPQTFHARTLVTIGRQHTVEQTYQAYEMARKVYFPHINLDLIAGLPGESPADFLASVKLALSLQPDSLTLHALALKRSANLTQQLNETTRTHNWLDQIKPQPDWLAAMAQAHALLADAGLAPYYLYRQKNVFSGLENVGFAAPDQGSLYNVGMMSDRRNVLGFGCGAASKKMDGDKTRRLTGPRHAGHYIHTFSEYLERKKDFWLRPSGA